MFRPSALLRTVGNAVVGSLLAPLLKKQQLVGKYILHFQSSSSVLVNNFGLNFLEWILVPSRLFKVKRFFSLAGVEFCLKSIFYKNAFDRNCQQN